MNQRTVVTIQEKERLRAEIEAQVQEYIRRGGRIDVVSEPVRESVSIIGDLTDSVQEWNQAVF